MAVTANSVITPQAPKTGYAVCTTANTTITDSPTNTQLLVTAGANGARVTKLSATPQGTVTATQLQLYLSKDAGATKRIIDSALMAAYSYTAITEVVTTDFGLSETNPLFLDAADRLYVGIGVTGNVAFKAEWGDY